MSLSNNKRGLSVLGRTALSALSGMACIAIIGCSSNEGSSNSPGDEGIAPTGSRLEAVIGAGGGELIGTAGTPFAGVHLTVPAGALAEDTKISIAPAAADAPLPKTAVPCGPEFAIEPAGLAFAEPVTLSLPVDQDAVEAQMRYADEVKVWALDGDSWGRKDQMDSSDGSVTIQLDSLTTVAAGVNPPQEQDVVHFDLTTANAALLKCFAQYPDDAKRQPKVDALIVRGDQNDSLFLRGKNIKPGLQFDLFSVERSPLAANGSKDPSVKAGFGMAWYQSDIEADKWGQVRVNVRTILLDQIFGFDPDVALAPTQTLHLGFWFNDPNDAAACGFDVTKPTPFNGEHKAGPLAMVTTPSAETGLGPLCTNPDTSVSPARCDP
jgi:hypothetical protein